MALPSNWRESFNVSRSTYIVVRDAYDAEDADVEDVVTVYKSVLRNFAIEEHPGAILNMGLASWLKRYVNTNSSDNKFYPEFKQSEYRLEFLNYVVQRYPTKQVSKKPPVAKIFKMIRR